MLQDQTAPAPTPAPTTLTQIEIPARPGGGPYTAREMYEAAQLQRRILRDQLSSAENQRDEIAQELRNPLVTDVDKAGLEQRLKVLDTRILDVQNQLADAQNREAQAAAVPGADQPTPQELANDRFEIGVAVSVMLALVIGVPFMFVHLRRLWKKHSVVVSLTPELTQRLDAIERAVETTAVEIERVGEGQRFVTQLLANRSVEQAHLPSRDR